METDSLACRARSYRRLLRVYFSLGDGWPFALGPRDVSEARNRSCSCRHHDSPPLYLLLHSESAQKSNV